MIIGFGRLSLRSCVDFEAALAQQLDDRQIDLKDRVVLIAGK